MFDVEEIYIHDSAKLVALTGLISIRELPGYEIPLTLILDKTGKELWRTNSEMLGLLNRGDYVLLNRSRAEENIEPCFRDEKNSVDYDCLRIVNAFTGKLKELITFPGQLGLLGFVEIWDDNHVAIGNQEGDIFFKDVEDNTLWKKQSEGLIAKAKIDKAYDMLIIERGLKDAVYDRTGKEIWTGTLRTKKIKSECRLIMI